MVVLQILCGICFEGINKSNLAETANLQNLNNKKCSHHELLGWEIHVHSCLSWVQTRVGEVHKITIEWGIQNTANQRYRNNGLKVSKWTNYLRSYLIRIQRNERLKELINNKWD